jgi:apolipoprotein N-acyltransferase
MGAVNPITRRRTLPAVKPVLLALIGAVVSVLAFPPFGPGVLIIAGITLFLMALRVSPTRRDGLLAGAVYGVVFFGGLMSWLAELELIALVLVPVQALFLAVYGWWLARFRDSAPFEWLLLAVGGWGVMELLRYHFPVGGLEWGAAGYALSDNLLTRLPAAAVGTSGLTVLVVMISALTASAATRRWDSRLLWSLVIVVAALVATVPTTTSHIDGPDLRVAIVQGSTPCPFEHCPPNERLRTYQQHLELTGNIEPGSVDLVVWSEGSTGSTNADPVLNEEVREAMAAEARRIDAAMLVGGDRTLTETHWINANVYFDREGEILGEYRKQHPVPFGEYVPLRRVFDWIPALDRVPRDMIPGDGPVVFEGDVGSVISFEGGFSRYPLETRRAGADVIVVATNEASYGPEAPTSDQFIGMTRMRAVELGVPIVHAAVTGKSTVTDRFGEFTLTTGLGGQEIFEAGYCCSNATPYTATGDLLMYLAAIAGILVWSRAPALVGSDDSPPR